MGGNFSCFSFGILRNRTFPSNFLSLSPYPGILGQAAFLDTMEDGWVIQPKKWFVGKILESSWNFWNLGNKRTFMETSEPESLPRSSEMICPMDIGPVTEYGTCCFTWTSPVSTVRRCLWNLGVAGVPFALGSFLLFLPGRRHVLVPEPQGNLGEWVRWAQPCLPLCWMLW